jgi:hypothetical protein
VTFAGPTAIASTFFPTIKFTLPAIQIRGTSPTVGNADVLDQSIPFVTKYDGTNAPCKIEYTHGDGGLVAASTVSATSDGTSSAPTPKPPRRSRRNSGGGRQGRDRSCSDRAPEVRGARPFLPPVHARQHRGRPLEAARTRPSSSTAGTISPKGTPITIRRYEPVTRAVERRRDAIVDDIGDALETAALRAGWH